MVEAWNSPLNPLRSSIVRGHWLTSTTGNGKYTSEDPYIQVTNPEELR